MGLPVRQARPQGRAGDKGLHAPFDGEQHQPGDLPGTHLNLMAGRRHEGNGTLEVCRAGCTPPPIFTPLPQMAERAPPSAWVAGSSPAWRDFNLDGPQPVETFAH